jgi:hypothetical protein
MTSRLSASTRVSGSDCMSVITGMPGKATCCSLRSLCIGLVFIRSWRCNRHGVSGGWQLSRNQPLGSWVCSRDQKRQRPRVATRPLKYNSEPTRRRRDQKLPEAITTTPVKCCKSVKLSSLDR